MEDLLGFLFIILAIVSSISKNKKKKQQAQARKQVRQELAGKNQNRAPYSMEALQAWFEEETEEKTAEQAAAPAAEITHEGIHPCDTHPSQPVTVAQPRIQARVQVTEKPQVVLGSMGVDSHEGIHPCDEHEEELSSGDAPLIAVPVEKPGIQLDWNGDSLVKAFVMQEVLTRPCQRRRA